MVHDQGYEEEAAAEERRWEDEQRAAASASGNGHRHGARTPTNGSAVSEASADGEGIMETVVLPVVDSIHDRVTNPAARASILRLRRAIEQAEREVPGLMNVLISEIVDSVEPEPEEI